VKARQDSRTGRFTAFRPGRTVLIVKPGSDRDGMTGRVLKENGNTGDSFQVLIRTNGESIVRSYHPINLRPIN
jgi:hypothetical protein